VVVRRWLDRALLAELLLALLLVGYDWFSPYRLVLLLLLASQSLWSRSLGWSDLGLARPPSLWRVVAQGIVGAGVVLLAVRFMIVPIAEKLTGVTVDLSQVEAIQGDPATLGIWLAQALTLAAFGEELVFRGYLMNRVADLFGKKRLGLVVGLLISSVGFGWAHRYQGDAGMVATGLIGALLALLYLRTRNLWAVIICHAVVDLTALILIYYGHKTWLFS